MAIKVLSEETAAKLAAGEVVERPVAVVRELVDNALDAGARRVSVLLTNGGLDLIKVVDDGHGIGREDLLLCTERHATSKLERIEDLARLHSLGFRGEALHAIASVSRLRLRSRERGLPGHEAEYEGLTLVGEGASGCPEGTQVEVRNLFYNTPARLKFLKGPTAEATRVDQLVRRYALGRPDVTFRLEVDGREVMRSLGTGVTTDVIGAVYSWTVLRSLIEVDACEEWVKLSGYVGAPDLSRANRSDMHVFVNGRWLQNRPLLFALQEAYSSLLMTGRFPLTVVHVLVPPDRIDINVHPAKNDVRFADERGVVGFVGRTVRAALLQRTSAASEPVSVAQFGFSLQAGERHIQTPTESNSQARTEQWHTDTGEEPAERGKLPPMRIVGQLAATYIIAEGPQGMCLIDQHAAHERVLLERLQDGRSRAMRSQALLEPVVAPLSPAQAQRADLWARELNMLGFQVDVFGEGSLLVRAVPADVPADRAGSLLAALEEGLEGLISEDERSQAMLATVACHSAIRAGQVMDATEMRALLRDLEATRVPTACAHGRPTLLEISRLDLEREFGRRGSR